MPAAEEIRQAFEAVRGLEPAGIAATALNLGEELMTLDVTSSQRAATSGLIAALHAVVGHGGALATALSMILDKSGNTWREYQMLNTALSKLVFDPEPRLEFFSDVSHLEEIGNLGEWQ
jgi:DNA-directed RNA polymerase specialized sigma54-like protein